MVRHHREVERPPKLGHPVRLARCVVGLDADGLALGETVGVVGAPTRALPPSVEAERRVDVRVSEEGAAERLVVGASCTLFGHGESRLERILRLRFPAADHDQRR